MNPKKSTRANLENKRSLFFQIGMVVSLLLMIGVFAHSQPEKHIADVTGPAPLPPIVEDPPLTREKEPVETNVRPVIINPQDLRIVPNSSNITVEIDWVDFIDNIPDPQPIRVETPITGDDAPFLRVETMPKFQGGTDADFRNWVMGKISYPQLAIDNGIEGRVTVTFVIEKDGSLTNIEVLSSPDRSLSDEAVRVLKQSPQWTPGYQRNSPVRVRFNIPLDFRLSR